MKITEGSNSVVNYVFSGAYGITHNQGLKPRLFEFSSPTYLINGFAPPYDAKLLNKESPLTALAGVARKIRNYQEEGVSTDRSGVLYYYDKANIYGTCHGYGANSKTYYSGYNFYNAFYPAGYISPPYGENISIFKANQDGQQALYNGGCGPLSVTEYNEQFGIVSKSASDTSLTSATLTPNVYSQIYSPKETCPPDVAITTYYDEINFNQIPGTTTQIGASTYYGDNPIPTSLDNFDIKVNGRYAYSGGETSNFIKFESGRPVASYNSDNEENKLNNTLCPATLMETRVSIGRGTNGIQLLETPDALFGNFNDQVSVVGADPWHYWHLTFQENAWSLPFYNNFNSIDTSTTKTTHRSLSQGTLLFAPVLSSDEYYWQNRQCPDTVDFLPWTVGASIYACPSEHFDVPYYAATKKFGFYGTRFFNACNKLNLSETWSGVSNASELPFSANGYSYEIDKGSLEPDGIDIAAGWSFSAYSNLLRTANAEERYSNMYAFNKGYFIWANNSYISGDPDFTALLHYSGFRQTYEGLVRKFQEVFASGLYSVSGNEPQVLLQSTVAGTNFSLFENGKHNDLLFTNREYEKFYKQLGTVISGGAWQNWEALENRYAYYITDGSEINEQFYTNIVSGREKRLRTRYFENLIRGNPVDLYPMNQIPFGFDSARQYLESSSWGRKTSTFGKGSPLPEIGRRYFEGAYGSSSLSSNLMTVLNNLASAQDTYFYPGFFNDIRKKKDMATPSYEPVISGIIMDTANRRFSASGWLAIGYHEVGQLDGNFSCFTPIFVQQPVQKVFCKIGQAPTFHTLAVDYHTIPEDKISYKYPEVMYWCEKLKLVNRRTKENLYPLSYLWYRIEKSKYSDFLASGDFGMAEKSSHSGSWCNLEGDSPNCTLIHPTECSPVYTGNPNQDLTFKKGAVYGLDDQYYYFCLASGRFGVRMSNVSELQIENWLKFDVSLKNAANATADVKVDFEVYDKDGAVNIVSFTPDGEETKGYAGYQLDEYAIPEGVIEQKIPPPNAGYGDVTAYRFIGNAGYIGATRTYAPSALRDTRGLREMWGHLMDYGNLVQMAKTLSQQEGDLLYGYEHLPECSNYAMPKGKAGVMVKPYYNGYKVSQWSLPQKAFASMDNKVGIKWDKLSHVGELYPPANSQTDTPNMGIGHWQWGNNLGAIKRFGIQSTVADEDIEFGGNGVPAGGKPTEDLLQKIKQKFVGPTELAGYNCGYNPYGLGRNMLYFLEAYERFYIYCDPIKKKNVTNRSFICPGVRNTNSAIQYFWLGKPANTYLERKSMYGPYAYQWKVKRHNRDRNGNGISEGFHSMGWGRRYSLLYDAPAVYGLYVRTETSPGYKDYVNDVLQKRATIFPDMTIPSLKSLWFGKRGDEGTSRPYGNYSFSCDETRVGYNQNLCDYVSAAGGLATSINFKDYSCPEYLLKAGQCFDPCISMRYAQGFFPGGKGQDMFGYSDGGQHIKKKNIRLVPYANFKNNSIIEKDEQSEEDETIYFRSPINTPHARVVRGMAGIGGIRVETPASDVGGISPCQDGGSDHCNYLTATIHLGKANQLIGVDSAFMKSYQEASSMYSDLSVRGE